MAILKIQKPILQNCIGHFKNYGGAGRKNHYQIVGHPQCGLSHN